MVTKRHEREAEAETQVLEDTIRLDFFDLWYFIHNIVYFVCKSLDLILLDVILALRILNLEGRTFSDAKNRIAHSEHSQQR